MTTKAARQITRASTTAQVAAHVVRCMEIWSGNQAVESAASTPGLELYVYSRRYRGEKLGSDVHYISLCAGGVVTRFFLADVSGHQPAADGTDGAFRTMIRRRINAKDQNRLVHDLNRELARLHEEGQSATAVVATYLSHRNRFILCNAGHPRPLWYRSKLGRWSYVNDEIVADSSVCDALASNYDFRLPVADDDVLVFYTDGLTKARNGNGEPLGESDLLRIVAGLPTYDVQALSRGIVAAVTGSSGDRAIDDDATILVVRFSAACRRYPGLWERLRGYARLLGLKAT